MGTAEKLQTMNEELVVKMDGMTLEESEDKFELLLGVKVQSNLKWSEQVETLAGKLKNRLTGLNHLRHSMSKTNKQTIVQGLFNSVLCYCLPLFGGCNTTELKNLQIQQNRAARIVLNLPPRFNRDIMYKRVGWMSVQQLIAYHSLLVVYRVRQSKEPEYLARPLSRDNYRGNIIIENSRLGLYKSSFIPRASALWNTLPAVLRNTAKVGTFKMELRKWVDANVRKFID